MTLDGSGEVPYQRSALCFAGALRYDICSPRARRSSPSPRPRRAGGRWCTGRSSWSGRRTSYVLAVEALLGETWEAEGLAGAGVVLAPETIWNTTLLRVSRPPCAGVAST